MAGLDPAIRAGLAEARTWMPGSSPGMTALMTSSPSHPEELQQQTVHLRRLFLLHPVAGAVDQMTPRMSVQAIVCIASNAPGLW